jgi:hypothetical protein
LPSTLFCAENKRFCAVLFYESKHGSQGLTEAHLTLFDKNTNFNGFFLFESVLTESHFFENFKAVKKIGENTRIRI